MHKSRKKFLLKPKKVKNNETQLKLESWVPEKNNILRKGVFKLFGPTLVGESK